MVGIPGLLAAGSLRRTARFAGKYPVKFAQSLGGQYNAVSRQAGDAIAGGLTALSITHTFGVGEQVGIKRQAHHCKS